MKSKCCNAPVTLTKSVTGEDKFGCNDCLMWCKVIDDTPPTDGEIVADGKAQVLLADEYNEWYDAYGMEIADGADPRKVIQRLLKEHEKRMNKTYIQGQDDAQYPRDAVVRAYDNGHIQGQIDAYTYIFEHASGGGYFRRLCVQKINQLKGE